MILNIRVIPRASRNLIKKEKDYLKIYITKPAQDNLANQELIKLLSKHFQVPRYRINIIKGSKSKDKLVEINE